MTELATARVATPLGEILLVAEGETLVGLDFDSRADWLEGQLARRYGTCRMIERADPAGAASRLRAYLAGDLEAFDGLTVETGGTPFQRRVWQGLRTIPSGTTLSYGGLAERIGATGASRAVGRANGQNPVAIVLPCHRVIGADNSLTGYGGGIERKRWLLRHEGVAVD